MDTSNLLRLSFEVDQFKTKDFILPEFVGKYRNLHRSGLMLKTTWVAPQSLSKHWVGTNFIIIIGQPVVKKKPIVVYIQRCLKRNRHRIQSFDIDQIQIDFDQWQIRSILKLSNKPMVDWVSRNL